MFETNKKPIDKQKLRGGYYTPLKLANFLVKWAVRTGNERILEPSAGDGNFIVAALNNHSNGHLDNHPSFVAVEIEREEVLKAKKRLIELGNEISNVEWICNDFFTVYRKLKNKEKFDAVVGNPPFIRFQYFDDDIREIAFSHLRDAGYNPTKLANAWAAFVQLSIELVKEGGRLAMVVPAELLQVKYAAELRSHLSKQFRHIVIIGFRKLVFPEIQQEVVLLLAEGKAGSLSEASDIQTIEFEDGEDLLKGDLNSAISHVPAKHSRNGMKWTSLFLSDKSFKVLDEAQQAKGLIPLGKLAEVDVGVVTGRNSFFILTKDFADAISADPFAVPIIGKTSALNSITFNELDFEKYSSQYPAFLLNLNGEDYSDLPENIREYLKIGEREKVHTGFKCRVRPRWYDVPSIHVPNAFMFRQIHRYPLLVINEALATSTDTIHRVKIKSNVVPRLLAASFFNSLTLAWAEVCGRSYGGGVLELEPREAEELPIPYSLRFDLDTEKVDRLLREGKDAEALDYVDRIVLKENLGFDKLMVKRLQNAWKELRDRRIHRR